MRFRLRHRRSPDGARAPATPGPPQACADDFVECAFATALGSRTDNQDRCAVGLRWAVLSDGAGGHAGGALAAELTVRAVVSRLEGADGNLPAALEAAVSDANAAVRRGREDSSVGNMAATLVMALAVSVDEAGSDWLVANVGDSRAWLVTADMAAQITEDDNVAAQLVRSGTLTPEEAVGHPGRNWITRAMGPEEHVAASITPLHLHPGEAVVIASDGLDSLSVEDIHAVLTGGVTPAEGAAALVAAALRKGALDNVTAAVVRHVARTDAAAPSTEEGQAGEEPEPPAPSVGAVETETTVSEAGEELEVPAPPVGAGETETTVSEAGEL